MSVYGYDTGDVLDGRARRLVESPLAARGGWRQFDCATPPTQSPPRRPRQMARWISRPG